MVRISATVPNLLSMLTNLLHESVGFEGSTVGQVRLDQDPMLKRHVFETLLRSNCLNSRKPKLMLHM